jgi:hypothetical protein
LRFGAALALRGNELLVGMPNYHDGRVAIFVREHSGPWMRAGSLDPGGPAQTEGFGGDIALGRNFALVAAGNGTYVFHRKKGAWIQTQILPGSGPMAISDDFIFSGTEVFRSNKDGTLRRVQILTAENAPPDAQFGASLAVLRGTLVVGAPGDVEGRGSAYIFRRHGQRWLLRQQLTASDGEPGDGFGSSVAIAQGVIAIGAPTAQSHGPDCLYVRGVAYAFAPAHSRWFEQQKVETPDCEPDVGLAFNFAFGIAASRDRLAAEIPAHFPDQPRRAFIYEKSGGMFMPIATTIGDLEDAGAAMQMSASTLVLGWPFRRVFGVGFAEIFEFARRDRPGHPRRRRVGRSGRRSRSSAAGAAPSGSLILLFVIPTTHSGHVLRWSSFQLPASADSAQALFAKAFAVCPTMIGG